MGRLDKSPCGWTGWATPGKYKHHKCPKCGGDTKRVKTPVSLKKSEWVKRSLSFGKRPKKKERKSGIEAQDNNPEL